MQRFYKDNTLVHQAFIKDGSISVADYVKSVNGDLKVVGFERISFLVPKSYKILNAYRNYIGICFFSLKCYKFDIYDINHKLFLTLIKVY